MLTHWSYVFPTLTHRYDVIIDSVSTAKLIVPQTPSFRDIDILQRFHIYGVSIHQPTFVFYVWNFAM